MPKLIHMSLRENVAAAAKKRPIHGQAVYRLCTDKSRKIVWGYHPMACVTCTDKPNPKRQKACFCPYAEMSRASYDRMWDEFLQKRSTPVRKHPLPTRPPVPLDDGDGVDPCGSEKGAPGPHAAAATLSPETPAPGPVRHPLVGVNGVSVGDVLPPVKRVRGRRRKAQVTPLTQRLGDPS